MNNIQLRDQRIRDHADYVVSNGRIREAVHGEYRTSA